MLTANISKTKNELSRYLDAVRRGETVVILDRNRPIAQIQPLSRDSGAGSARLRELQAAGAIVRPAASIPAWHERLSLRPGETEDPVGSVDALLEERDSAR